MRDQDVELVFNRMQEQYSKDHDRLSLEIGIFVADCIETKHDRIMRGRPFDTATFVENYDFDAASAQASRILTQRETISRVEDKIGDLADFLTGIKDIAAESSGFWRGFWKDYLIGLVVSFIFPVIALALFIIIVLVFSIDISPQSLGNTLRKWLSATGG